jgi:hypothetical protein
VPVGGAVGAGLPADDGSIHYVELSLNGAPLRAGQWLCCSARRLASAAADTCRQVLVGEPLHGLALAWSPASVDGR